MIDLECNQCNLCIKKCQDVMLSEKHISYTSTSAHLQNNKIPTTKNSYFSVIQRPQINDTNSSYNPIFILLTVSSLNFASLSRICQREAKSTSSRVFFRLKDQNQVIHSLFNCVQQIAVTSTKHSCMHSCTFALTVVTKQPLRRTFWRNG